ncbi:hypothetical protein [Microseira wollei]|uniref:hypothetical protein n=1 Tax=Microseira wollei TaxID=467598 RepID=UPI001CFCBF20|nr:hypothetical protein [Microseira wollei]
MAKKLRQSCQPENDIILRITPSVFHEIYHIRWHRHRAYGGFINIIRFRLNGTGKTHTVNTINHKSRDVTCKSRDVTCNVSTTGHDITSIALGASSCLKI